MGLILLACILAWQDSPIRSWNPAFISGVGPFKAGSQISAILTREGLKLRSVNGDRAIEIPISAITKVAFDLRTRRPAMDAFGNATTGALENGVGQGEAYLVLLLPILAVVSSPYKKTEGLVYLQWHEPGVDSEVLLRLEKKDLDPFLAALREATGKPWKQAMPRVQKR